MNTKTVKITGDCALVWVRYGDGPDGYVVIRYTEHSTDHYFEDSVTDADIDVATARDIAALFVAAFGPAVLPAVEAA
jgi:hypothetical protein